MNFRIPVSAAVLLCFLVLLAGCTGTQNVPAAPAVPPQAGTSPALVTSSAADLVPTETDSLGDARNIFVNIEKDHLGMIHATFQGGPGLIHVKKIDVTVNRADGQVKTGTVGINVDDTVTLEGTKESDRVIVYVSLDDGKTYKIYDDLVVFKRP